MPPLTAGSATVGVWETPAANTFPHKRDPNPPGAAFLAFTRGELDWGPTHLPEETMTDSKHATLAVWPLQKPHDRPFVSACGHFHPRMPWWVPQKYFDDRMGRVPK